jgi:hypothetical protein
MSEQDFDENMATALKAIGIATILFVIITLLWAILN